MQYMNILRFFKELNIFIDKMLNFRVHTECKNINQKFNLDVRNNFV